MKYYLIYSKNQVRGSSAGTLTQLRRRVRRWEPDRWAIYREYDGVGNKFHSTADERFLVEHDDPSWRNRGY